MTKKLTRWWHQISFWTKLKTILLSLGIGGEITLFVGESHSKWKVLAGVATFLSIIITQMFQDNNNNGQVDMFEKKEPPQDEK